MYYFVYLHMIRKELKHTDFKMKLVKDLGVINNRRFALFKCSVCEKTYKYRVDNLNLKKRNKCNVCFNKDKINSSGRLGIIWVNIIQRCRNKNNPQYENYGGRGIDVCDDWSLNFISFKKWALKNGYNDKLFIDRKNNDKGYHPNNCRFVNRIIQNNNRRIYKTSKSNFRGVSKYNEKWRVRISIKGKRVSLGIYKNVKDAAKAYNEYIIKNKLKIKLNNLN